MRLFYYQTNRKNVGDDFNSWLFPKLLPGMIDGSGDHLIGIGSILDRRVNSLNGRKIIFGTGARDKWSATALDSSIDVKFVRGPKTANAIYGSDYIVDPAFLAKDFFEKKPIKRIGFVPYFRNRGISWAKIFNYTDVLIINPQQDIEHFMAQIGSCEKVFSESLHGAIFADALRIPWRPVRAWNYLHEGYTHFFKWSDWCESVKVPFDPITLPLVWNDSRFGYMKGAIKKVIAKYKIETGQKRRFYLSDDAVWHEKLDQLRDAFNDLRKENS